MVPSCKERVGRHELLHVPQSICQMANRYGRPLLLQQALCGIGGEVLHWHVVCKHHSKAKKKNRWAWFIHTTPCSGFSCQSTQPDGTVIFGSLPHHGGAATVLVGFRPLHCPQRISSAREQRLGPGAQAHTLDCCGNYLLHHKIVWE